ncbi:MAG: hypothetical protein IJS68_00955 [Clostridia bacterium]|nr:hypothetical protein [Clostridia bacterium]
MKKATKVLLIILISIVIGFGAIVGGSLLLRKQPTPEVIPEPEPSKYTEEEKNFIDSIDNSSDAMNNAEPFVFEASTVNFSDLIDVSDKYFVTNESGTMSIYKRGSEIQKIVGTGVNEYNKVYDLRGNFALVQKDAGNAFLINLETAARVSDQAFVFGSNVAFEHGESSVEYVPKYKFVGTKYFVYALSSSYTTFGNTPDYNLVVVNLSNGNVFNFTADETTVSTSTCLLLDYESLLSYSVTEEFLLIKTTRRTLVYRFNDDEIVKVFERTNDFTTTGTSSSSYTYKFYDVGAGAGTYYDCNCQYGVSIASSNKLFVSRLVKVDNPEDATFKNYKDQFYKQTCFFYDISTQNEIAYETDGKVVGTLDMQISGFTQLGAIDTKLEGFILLTKTGVNDDKTINELSITANYYEVSTLKSVATYNYYEYGHVVAFHDGNLVCASRSYASLSEVLYNLYLVSFDGTLQTWGGELSNKEYVRTKLLSFYDGNFVFNDLNGKTYIANFDGEIKTTSWKDVTPIVGGHSITLSSLGGYINNYDVTTSTHQKISNFCDSVTIVSDAYYKLYSLETKLSSSDKFYEFALKNGVNYYLTGTASNYTLRSITGSAIDEGITAFKILITENSIKTFYITASDVKITISSMQKVNSLSTIASVSYNKPKTASNNVAVLASNANYSDASETAFLATNVATSNINLNGSISPTVLDIGNELTVTGQQLSIAESNLTSQIQTALDDKFGDLYAQYVEDFNASNSNSFYDDLTWTQVGVDYSFSGGRVVSDYYANLPLSVYERLLGAIDYDATQYSGNSKFPAWGFGGERHWVEVLSKNEVYRYGDAVGISLSINFSARLNGISLMLLHDDIEESDEAEFGKIIRVGSNRYSVLSTMFDLRANVSIGLVGDDASNYVFGMGDLTHFSLKSESGNGIGNWNPPNYGGVQKHFFNLQSMINEINNEFYFEQSASWRFDSGFQQNYQDIILTDSTFTATPINYFKMDVRIDRRLSRVGTSDHYDEVVTIKSNIDPTINLVITRSDISHTTSKGGTETTAFCTTNEKIEYNTANAQYCLSLDIVPGYYFLSPLGAVTKQDTHYFSNLWNGEHDVDPPVERSYPFVFFDAYSVTRFIDPDNNDADMIDQAIKSGNSGELDGQPVAKFYKPERGPQGELTAFSATDLGKLFVEIDSEYFYLIFTDGAEGNYEGFYGFFNNRKFRNNLPFIISKPGYEISKYSLGPENYSNSTSGNNVFVANPIYVKTSEDKMVARDAPTTSVLFSTPTYNYKSSAEQTWWNTVEEGYSYTHQNSLPTIMSLFDFNFSAESVLTKEDSQSYYLAPCNDFTAVKLYASWDVKNYTVVLYAEQENVDGESLVSNPAEDWYIYNYDSENPGASAYIYGDAFDGTGAFRAVPIITPSGIYDGPQIIEGSKDSGKKSIVYVTSSNSNFTISQEISNSYPFAVPTKFGYEFVGWRPMQFKQANVGDGTISYFVEIDPTGGHDIKIESVDENGIAYTIGETGANSFVDFALQCDALNMNGDLFFKAIFTPISYTLEVTYTHEGIDGLDVAFGAGWRDKGEFVYSGSTSITSLRIERAGMSIGNGRIDPMPTMLDAKVLQKNYRYYVVDDTFDDSNDIYSDYLETDSVLGATAYNLLGHLKKINTAIKNAGKYSDAINDRNGIFSAYALTKVSVNAIMTPVDYFFTMSNGGLALETHADYFVDKNNSADGTIITTETEENRIVCVPATKQLELGNFTIENNETKKISQVRVVAYTGNNTPSPLGPANQVWVIVYNILWKNNKVYGVEVVGAYVTYAENASSTSLSASLSSEQIEELAVEYFGIAAPVGGNITLETLGNLVYTSNDKIACKFQNISHNFARLGAIYESGATVHLRSTEMLLFYDDIKYDITIKAFGDLNGSLDFVNATPATTNVSDGAVNPVNVNVGAIYKDETSIVDGAQSTLNKNTQGAFSHSVTKSLDATYTGIVYNIVCGGIYINSVNDFSRVLYDHLPSKISIAKFGDVANETFIGLPESLALSFDVDFDNGAIKLIINGADYILSATDTTETFAIVDGANLVVDMRYIDGGNAFLLTPKIELDMSEFNNDILIAVEFEELAKGSLKILKTIDGGEGTVEASQVDLYATGEAFQYELVADSGCFINNVEIKMPNNPTGEIVMFNTISRAGIETGIVYTARFNHCSGGSAQTYDDSFITFAYDAGKYVMTIRGLYGYLEVIVNQQSITAVEVKNVGVKVADSLSGTNLDYDITLRKDSVSKAILSGVNSFTLLSDTSSDVLSEQYYIIFDLLSDGVTPDETSPIFIFLGKGSALVVDFEIKQEYEDVEDIGAIVCENSTDYGANNGTSVTDIVPTNNFVGVSLRNYTFSLEVNIDAGYYTENVGGDQIWMSYRRNDYTTDASMLDLLIKRLDFQVDYYGLTDKGYFKDYLYIFFGEDMGGSRYATEDRTCEFRVVKGKGYSFVYKVLSNGYESDIEVLVNNTLQEFDTEHSETVGSSTKLIFDALNKSSNTTTQTIDIRIVAKPLTLKYSLYEGENAPSTFDANAIATYAGTSTQFNTTNTTTKVWFDGKLNNANLLGNLAVAGHEFLGWFLGGAEIERDAQGFYVRTVSGKKLAIGDEVNSETLDGGFVFISELDLAGNQDTIDVYAQWAVKSIRITFYLNDSRSGNGSTVGLYNNDASNPQSVSGAYAYNEEFGTKIDFTKFTRNGYVFAGFQISGGAYSSNQPLYLSNSKVQFDLPDGAVQNLYAKWIPIEYEIRYVKSGLSLVYDEDKNITMINPVSNTGSTERFVGLDGGADPETLVLRVKFDAPISYPTIVCTGYDFLGWYIDLPNNGGSMDVSNLSNLSRQNDPAHYYQTVAANGTTKLIWEYIFASDSGFLYDSSNKEATSNGGYVSVETRWRLQGVKVRLVTSTKLFDPQEDVLTQGKARTVAEQEQLATIARTKGSGTLLDYLLKDGNGNDNGITNNFYTQSAQVSTESGQTTIFYDLIIPYYSAKGSSSSITSYDVNGISLQGVKAPTSVGFNFLGYYYYNVTTSAFEANPRIVDSGNGTCSLSNYFDYWTLEQPDAAQMVVLYACWKIKTFTVSFDAPQTYLTDANDFQDTVGFMPGSLLSFEIELYDEEGNEIEPEASYSEVSGANGVHINNVKFYQGIKVKVTTPDGHYISQIQINSTTWEATWNPNSYSTNFPNDLCAKVVADSLQKRSLDNLIMADSSAYTVSEGSGIHSLTTGKRNALGTINHVIDNYVVHLRFALQFFNIVVYQEKYSNNNEWVSETPIKLDNIDFMGTFDPNEITGGPAYATTGFYKDKDFKEKFDTLLDFIVDNIAVYQKLVESNSDRIGATFYTWTGTKYEPIETGNTYVYSIKAEDGRVYINGEGSTWTDAIVGTTIVKFPVVTSFYWPSRVDGVSTGIQFAYWAYIPAIVEDDGTITNVAVNEMLTPYVLYEDYEQYQPYVYCHPKDASSMRAPFTAEMRLYAVFDTMDRTAPVTQQTYSGQTTSTKMFEKDDEKYNNLELKVNLEKFNINTSHNSSSAVEFYLDEVLVSNAVQVDNGYATVEMDAQTFSGLSVGNHIAKFKIITDIGNVYYSTPVGLTIVEE